MTTGRLTSSWPLAVGIDIGGTTSRAALVDQQGNILDLARRPTPAGFDELTGWIRAMYVALSAGRLAPVPLGLALPGVVDRAKGMLVRSVNLAWLERQPLVATLERDAGIRPHLTSDAEAATWAEYVQCDDSFDSFVHLRLGTGVACGVVIHGTLLPTDPARRDHWPVLIVDQSANAPQCPCGLRGCLELYASGKSLTAKARALGFQELADLQSALEAGDPRADAVIEDAARAVNTAIGNLAARFAVETVVMGGGVLTALPSLFNLVRDAYERENPEGSVAVQASRLGDDAGIIGAASLALLHNQPK